MNSKMETRITASDKTAEKSVLFLEIQFLPPDFCGSHIMKTGVSVVLFLLF